VFVSNVLVQPGCAFESLSTMGTREGFVSVVQGNMLVPVSQLDEFLGAVRTGEGFLSCMK